MTKELEILLEAARKKRVTPPEQEKQRRSFAYGNANIENSRVTRETVEGEAEALKSQRRKS